MSKKVNTNPQNPTQTTETGQISEIIQNAGESMPGEIVPPRAPKRRKKKVYKPVKFHPKEFAADLIGFREKKKLTLRAVSKACKVSVNMLYRAELTGELPGEAFAKVLNLIEKPINKYFY